MQRAEPNKVVDSLGSYGTYGADGEEEKVIFPCSSGFNSLLIEAVNVAS